MSLGKDKAEAHRRFHELMAKQDVELRDSVAAQSGETAYDLACKFLMWSRKNQEPRTTEAHKDWLLRFFANIGKRISVDMLKPYHVVEFMDTLEGDGAKRQAASSIQRVFTWAVEMGHIENHPCTRIKKPASHRRESWMSHEEYELVVSHSDGAFGDLVRFLWLSGCRPQEATSMKPEYVEGDRVVFPRKKTKGKRTPRVIYMNEEARSIVERRTKTCDEYVFENSHGTQWNRHTISRRFLTLKKHTKRKLCAYEIRHSFATRKLMEGHDPITVAALMSHKDLKMLMEIYAHVDQQANHLRKAAK